MSEVFDVILGGLDTEVDVTIADSTGVDPSVLLALRGEKGDTGATGAAGRDGTDGISPIANISKVGDTATITITDANGTTTATVTDGTDGINGIDGIDGTDGADGYSPTATVTKSGDTATITITDINGTTTATVQDGTQANAFTAEFGTTTYADVKDAYDDDAILICTVDDSGNTMTLQLAYFDVANEIFYFAFPMSDGWYWTQLSNADGWDDGQFYFASTDVATQLEDGLMSALDKQKLDNIASGAEVNVQSDWNQSVNTADDYIKNKPTIPSNVSDLVNDSGFITSPNVVYCTCSTAGGTAAKVATIESGSLTSLNEGDQAIVKFTNANSVASPTLQIGTTTAKSIKRYGTTAPSTSAATSWNAGSAVYFVYDGTYWQQIGFLNTTYSEISQANITNGSGSSTGLVTGRRAKAAVEAFAPIQDVTVDGTSVLSGTTAAIDLSGKSDVGHTHTKSEITDFPALAAVATTGNYNSLTDKPAIHNVPSGGSSGQVLSKASGTDYDLAWVNQSGGGGGGGITDVEVDGTSVVTGGVAEIDLTGKSDVGHTHTKSAITDFPSIPTITDTYSGTSQDGMSGIAVKSAIDALDGTVSGTAGSGKTLTAFSQTDGKVSATFGNISITKSQVSDFPTIPTVNDATLTIQKNGTNVATFTANASSNVTANISVPTDTGDLTNGAGYITGVTSTSTPTASTISEFDASSHINSEDMSAQDVSDFIDGLNVSGISIVDYVVEQGTDGIWTYRKWNSGIAECWGLYTTSSMTLTRAFGVIYTHTSEVGGVDFPFTFTSAPIEIDCMRNSNCWIMYAATQTATKSKTFWIARPSSYSTSASYAIEIYAKGKWK